MDLSHYLNPVLGYSPVNSLSAKTKNYNQCLQIISWQAAEAGFVEFG